MNPEIRSADDLRGIDSDWLARDADDYVGLLSTAGGGYTPEGFVQNLDAHVAATFLADPTVWLQPLRHPSPQPNCLQSWSVYSATCSIAAFSSQR